MSYAREDRPAVDRLRTGLRRLHHDVWLDDQLSVGEAWWGTILAEIRACDAMVVALSPALLDSAACTAEREYAHALGKVILPVCVRPVRTELLPPDLAPLQMVDFSTPSSEGAFELAYALAALAESPPLPVELPDPPAIPVSYLGDLNVRVHAQSLTLDEQLALVARLRGAMSRDQEREPALELLRALRQRDDLYHSCAQEIDAVVRDAEGMARGRPGDGRAGAASSTTAHLPPPTPLPHPPPGLPGPMDPHPSVATSEAHWRLAVASLGISVFVMVAVSSYGWAFPLLAGAAAPFWADRVDRRTRALDLRGARRASSWARATGVFGVVGSVVVACWFVVLVVSDLGAGY